MPSTEKTKRSELTGTVDAFINRKKRENNITEDSDTPFLNIIDFIERFKLLPYGLYPVQKFIIKLYYGIPLDGVNKVIPVSNKTNTENLYNFTEVEYLQYLHDSGRCNIRTQEKTSRKELILVLGRRSGKSTLAAIIAAYEIYKLLSRGHPQSYYGVPSGNEIRVLCIANDKEQASIVYSEMQGHIESVEYFKSSQVAATQTFMKFQTENDRKKFGPNGKGTIVSTFKSSIAKGLRGRGIMCCILDELAFFVDDGKSSAERVYKAILPSIAQFSPKDPKNKTVAAGPTDGRIIAISSPDAREGFFYRLYQTATSNDIASRNMLMIQAPTWEVNPTLHHTYYEVEYSKDPKSFDTEHGAEFSDRVRGWIEDAKDLTDCIVPGLKPQLKGMTREPYWAGLDFAISNDGTSVALTHLNNGRIELGYHETWYPKKRWKDSNPHLEAPLVVYAHTLQDRPRLDIDEIVEWLRVLSVKFHIVKGVFDQWAGPIIEQAMHKKGLTQFSTRNFSTSDTSQAYSMMKMLMYSKQIGLYDYPVPERSAIAEGKTLHSPHIQELLELQATSGGKNITIVQAPNSAGKHDDFSDALVRSILLASEHTAAHPDALEASKRGYSVQQDVVQPYSYHHYHRIRERLHGPPPKERTVPRGYRSR